MSEVDQPLGAPAVIVYLTGLSIGAQIFVAIAMFAQSTGEGTYLAGALNFYAMAFAGLGVLSLLEFFLLRKNLKYLGGGGIAVILELVKMVLCTNASNDISGSASTFSVIFALSIGLFGGVLISKYFRDYFQRLGDTDIMKQVLQLVPAIVILSLFMGTYFVEVLGFGAERQAYPDDVATYENPDIDWGAFNKPIWDATSFIDFQTAGLATPFQIVFMAQNIQSGSLLPEKVAAYWRKETFNRYGYDPSTSGSGWLDSTLKNRDIDLSADSLFSQPISSRTASLQVEMNVSTDGVYSEYIPTTWSSQYGAYPDSSSFAIEGGDITDTTIYETYLFGDTDPDVSFLESTATKSNLAFSSDMSGEHLLTYIVDYDGPDLGQVAGRSAGQKEDIYTGLLTKIRAASGGSWDVDKTWSAIKSYYGDLPSGNDLPSGISTYDDWADGNHNLFTQLYNEALNPSLSAGQQALNFVSVLRENYCSVDTEMLSGAAVDPTAFEQGEDYPAANQDYVDWFLEREKGLSAHFATTTAMLLRKAGIPCRVVNGYNGYFSEIAGDYITYEPLLQQLEDEPDDKSVIRAIYSWTWVEVLIPVDSSTDPHFEWMRLECTEKLASSSTYLVSSDLEADDFGEIPMTNLALLAEHNETASFEELDGIDNLYLNGSMTDLSSQANISVRLLTVFETDVAGIKAPLSAMPLVNQSVIFQAFDVDEQGKEGAQVHLYKNGTGDRFYSFASMTDSTGKATLNFTFDGNAHGLRLRVLFKAIYQLDENTTFIAKCAESVKFDPFNNPGRPVLQLVKARKSPIDISSSFCNVRKEEIDPKKYTKEDLREFTFCIVKNQKEQLFPRDFFSSISIRAALPTFYSLNECNKHYKLREDICCL